MTSTDNLTDAQVREMFDEMIAKAESPVLNEHGAADYIGVSVQWLRNNRRAPFAPPVMKYGPKTIRYHRDDLNRWLEAQRVAA